MQASRLGFNFVNSVKMQGWIVLAIFLPLLMAAPFDSNLDEHWESFKETYNKNYKGSEEGARRMIFEENIQFIVKHNLEADLGQHSFRLGITKFADLSHDEYVKMTSCLARGNTSKPSTESVFRGPKKMKIPEEIDWVKEGLVTDAKDQGSCGSCYAFAAIGALEGQHKKSTGELVVLSEQNVVDCSRDEGNHGCSGGESHWALKYIMKNEGVDKGDSYPYEERAKDCRYTEITKGSNCTNSLWIKKGTEEELQWTLAVTGPVAVALDASSRKLQLYKSGVYSDKDCNKRYLNHAVLAVGYGKLDGKDFWKIKNSWGKKWGLGGYFLIARNRDSMCGIADEVTVAVV